MAKMRIALAGAHFGALCSLRQIRLFHDVALRNRFGETGTPGVTIELIEGTEKRFAADNIDVDSRAEIIPMLIVKRALGAVLAGQPILFRSQTRTQFGVGWNWFGVIEF